MNRIFRRWFAGARLVFVSAGEEMSKDERAVRDAAGVGFLMSLAFVRLDMEDCDVEQRAKLKQLRTELNRYNSDFSKDSLKQIKKLGRELCRMIAPECEGEYERIFG